MALQIRLFGVFAIDVDGAPAGEMSRTRVQELIAYLLVHRNEAIARAVLATAFWPDVGNEQALKNLRTVVTRLRELLPVVDPYLRIDSHSIQWSLDGNCSVDLLHFEQARGEGLAALLAGDFAAAAHQFARAVELYTGDFLVGHEGAWIELERGRLHAAWLDALEQGALLLERAGAYYHARECAQRLLAADPLRETAYASLMRSQMALGDRAGALRTYHTCAALLRDELGVDPGGETQAVYEAVLFEDGRASLGPALGVEVVATLGRKTPGVAQQWVVAGAPLVGRERTMAWLRERWAAMQMSPTQLGTTQMSEPQVVVLAGEAGIGKTRVAQEFVSWVEREAGGETAIARAYAAGAAAYAPVAAWLRTAAGERRLRATPVHVRREAARLLPELVSEQPFLAAPEPIVESWQRHRFLQAMAEALSGEGKEKTPLLLLLEDAQWADAETLAWLPQLLETTQGKPLLVLLTLRLEESPENGALERLLGELRRTRVLHERELRRLNLEETTQLARTLAGEQAFDSDAASREAALFRETEGIPLFIVETVRAGLGEAAAGASEQVVAADALHLSPVVLATLRARMEQMSTPARELAECAAVLGREFRYGDLAATSQGDEETLVRALDELWRKRIVREQGADAYDFSHDKLRAVVYSGLSNARRRMLHRRAAEAVRLHDQIAGRSAEIALHYELAGEMQSALVYFREAATTARAIYATNEAIHLHQKLLEKEFFDLLAPLERLEVQMALGDLMRHEDRGRECEATYRAAAQTASLLGDTLQSARAKFGIGVSLLLQGNYEDALTTFEHVLSVFEQEERLHDVMEVLRFTRQIWFDRSDIVRADAILERWIEIAVQIDDKEALVDALNEMGLSRQSRGDLVTAQKHSARALSLAQSVGYKPGIVRALDVAARVETDHARSVELMRDAALAARELGLWLSYCYSLNWISYMLCVRGDYLRGITGFLLSTERHLTVGGRLNAVTSMILCGRAMTSLGYAEIAEEILEATIVALQEIGIPRWLIWSHGSYAELLVENGRLEEAQAQIVSARLCGGDEPIVHGGKVDFARILAMLDARIAAAHSSLDKYEIASALAAVSKGANLSIQAEASYWTWKLTGLSQHMLRAIECQRESYSSDGDARALARFHELTGEQLPEPLSLPDLSALIPHVLDLESARRRIRIVLDALQTN